MTAPTEVHTLTREYGVRYTAPGAGTVTIRCSSFDDASDNLDWCAACGIFDAEIVSREVPDWTISRSGLPDTVRALADAHADEAVSDSLVRAKLALWLADRRPDDVLLWPAWQALVKTVAEHRQADDEGRSEDVKELDGEIRELVAKVIGRTR